MNNVTLTRLRSGYIVTVLTCKQHSHFFRTLEKAMKYISNIISD